MWRGNSTRALGSCRRSDILLRNMNTIRKARTTDLPLLVLMEGEYARDQRRSVLVENGRLRPYMQRVSGAKSALVLREVSKYFRQCLRSRNVVVSIAEQDSHPVGFSIVSIRTSPPIRKLRRHGNIDVFFVRRKYRGRGISSLMMDRATKWFIRRGVKHVGLEVINDNKLARAIYKKWGFYDFFVEMRKEI